MVTSLANFRSDFTIVHIPGGNYLDVREQLYTNINVLRMGCSGRSALTLEEPRYVLLRNSYTLKLRYFLLQRNHERPLYISIHHPRQALHTIVRLLQGSRS